MDPSHSMIFTPTRLKRNSKAPERFSSDDIKIDTSNNETPGSGNQGEGTSKKKSSTSSSNNKLPIREPLKVKLPRLKRLQSMPLQIKVKISRNSNGGNIVNTSGTPSVTKIKLPIHRQKSDNIGAHKREVISPPSGNEGPPTSNQTSDDLKSTLPTKNLTEDHDSHHGAKANLPAEFNETSIDPEISLEDEINSSFSSDNSGDSAMQIIVERKSEQNDSGIRCTCGVDDDLGVMVECESCSTWQHGHCINVGIEEDAYEGYICGYCSLPPGKHQESLVQLTVGDKFQAKFEALETLMRQKAKNQDSEDQIESTDENQFSLNEVERVVKDLKRVFTSLKVKWKLLTSDDYPTELKIWKNPIWSDKLEENLKQKQQQTVRFIGDTYKNNLKLNICNMLNKMHRRCQLIRYQIARLEEAQSSQDSKSTFDTLLTTLDDISRVVEEFSDKLKQN